MINTNDFFNAMAVFGAIIYLFRKKNSQDDSAFSVKITTINDYDKSLKKSSIIFIQMT
jgi:hypothetical protein